MKSDHSFLREQRYSSLRYVFFTREPSSTLILPTKLTGKVGKNSFGFLVASDNAPGNFDSDSRIDPEVRPFIDEFVDQQRAVCSFASKARRR